MFRLGLGNLKSSVDNKIGESIVGLKTGGLQHIKPRHMEQRETMLPSLDP